MMYRFWFGKALLLAGAAVATAGILGAQPLPADNAATLTVTAVGKKDNPPPPLKREDVSFFVGKEKTQIADWQKGDTLFLAVLIDDSLESNIAGLWPELRAFMMAQPDNTYIAVAYIRNGTGIVAQDFTKDHALAAKALRIPLGNSGAFTSPYLALQDWIKRWPDSNERKSILLLSSGIDYFRGTFDPADPDIDTTIEQAQKKNINIWSIYAPDAGHRARRNYPVFLGQGFLSRVGEGTGAESFDLGFGPPVSLKPFLDELQMHLNNQYLLRFVGNGGNKGKLERVRVNTELQGAEFLAAPEAFLPAAQ